MGEILAFIPTLFGTVLHFINGIVGNYGWAIIIFTIIIRLIIFPLTIKQLQSAAKTQELQPKLAEIQERYKNDKEKLRQEQMKLYKEEGINPLGGCLPLLVQMPILISLYNAFSYPLTYQLNMHAETLTDAFKKTYAGGFGQLEYVNPIIHPEHIGLGFNFNFLGIFDLGHIPNLNSVTVANISGLALVLIATVLTFFSIKLSMKRPNQPAPQPGKDGKNSMAQMNKTMMFMMPAMTLFFGFSFPGGLTLYWAAGYVIQILQQLAINKWFHGRKKEVVLVDK